jgi:hypothetical protein
MDAQIRKPSPEFIQKAREAQKISVAELFREYDLQPPVELPAALLTDSIDFEVGTDGWSAHVGVAKEPGWTLLGSTFQDIRLEIGRSEGVTTATFEGSLKTSIAALLGSLQIAAPDFLAPIANAPLDVTAKLERNGWKAGGKATKGFDLALGGRPSLTARFQDLRLDASRIDGVSKATFEGRVDLGGVALNLSFALPGKVSFNGSFDNVRLTQAMRLFGPIELPPGFDLELGKNSVTLTKDGDKASLVARTTVNRAGTFELRASRGKEKWDCTFEGAAGDPAALPGLALVATLVTSFGVRNVKLVATNAQQPWLSFQGNVSRDSVLRHLVLLLEYLGVRIDESKPVTVGVASPVEQSKVTIPFTSSTFKGNAGLKLANGRPDVFLDGTCSTSFGTFDVSASATATGVLISGSSSNARVSVADLFSLRDMGVTVGVNFGGIPSFGFFGTFDFRKWEMSVAFFANSVDPAASMVAASLDALTLNDLVDLVGGAPVFFLVDDVLKRIAIRPIRTFYADPSLGNALDAGDVAKARAILAKHDIQLDDDLQLRIFTNKRGSKWHFAPLVQEVRHFSATRENQRIRVEEAGQLYFAPSNTKVGGIEFRQGMRVRADVEFLGVRGRIRAELEKKKGFRASVEMQPIRIISADFFELTAAGKPNEGPTISIATYGDVHARASGSIRILRAAFLEAEMFGSDRGIQFMVAGEVTPFISARLSILASSGSAAEIVHSQVKIKFPTLDLPIGKIGTPVEVAVGIRGTANDTRIQGTFVLAAPGGFPSWTIRLPEVVLPMSVGIPGMYEFVYDLIKKHIADKLGSATWLQIAKAGVFILPESAEIAGILVKHFAASIAETASMLRNLGKSASEAVNALTKLPSDPHAAFQGMLEAGYSLRDAASAMKSQFERTPEVVVAIATKVYGGVTRISAEAANQIATVMKDVFKLDADTMVPVFMKAGYIATDVGRILRDAGYHVNDVASTLRKYFSWSANQTADFLKNGLNYGKDAVDAALKQAGYGVNEVGKAIETFFTSTINPSRW